LAKRYKKTSKKRETKKLDKVNKYTVFLGTFVLMIILMLVVYYSNFIQISKEPESYQEIQKPTITTEMAIGGSCKRDSECFITYCKDSQTKGCVNTTQLSTYSKNCKTYSDWIIEVRDPSKCACIQNSCTMITSNKYCNVDEDCEIKIICDKDCSPCPCINHECFNKKWDLDVDCSPPLGVSCPPAPSWVTNCKCIDSECVDCRGNECKTD